MSTSKLDIGDIENENSDSNDNSKSSSDSSEESEDSNESRKSKKKKKSGEDSESEESESEESHNEEKEKNEKKKDKKEDKKSKSNKINEIKLKNKDEKSSKSKGMITDSQNKDKNVETGIKNENNILLERNSSIHTKKETKNRFYIPQYNQRMETIMNILTEDYSSEKDNIEEEKIRKEKEIIKREKEARKKFRKAEDVRFQINATPKDLNEFMKDEEMKLQKEKIRYLEEKNLRLDKLNQMYYDMIKEANLDKFKNNDNNDNNMKLQSLDNMNDSNNISKLKNSFNNQTKEDMEFMIQNYIDGERNRNIHNFNDSMIDVNKKITNFLIDNCQEQKDKNRRLESFKYEIGKKLDRIEYIQKKQKHDIDFIIKYGLNKNRALDPIIGQLLENQRPLPKLLKDIDEENKYEKVMDGKNYIPYKNFYLNGRYSHLNKKEDNDDSSNKNGEVLRKTGSCIFENRKNPFNYKLKENGIYNKNNPNIKRPFFENKNIERKNIKKSLEKEYEEEEYQKFIAYKGKYFIPKDFRFGGVKEKPNNTIKPKSYKNKNEIDFII